MVDREKLDSYGRYYQLIVIYSESDGQGRGFARVCLLVPP
jgi:hypothetical protein